MHFRYGKNLFQAKAYGIQKGLVGGAGMGFFFFVIFGTYALAFWYGGKLVREEDYTPGQMLIVSIFFVKNHRCNIQFEHVRQCYKLVCWCNLTSLGIDNRNAFCVVVVLCYSPAM